MNFVSPCSCWLIRSRKEQLKTWLNVFTAFSTLANIVITQHFIEVLRIPKPQSFGSEKWISLQDQKTPQSSLTRHGSCITRFDHCRKSLLVLERFISKSRILSVQSPFETQDSLFFQSYGSAVFILLSQIQGRILPSETWKGEGGPTSPGSCFPWVQPCCISKIPSPAPPFPASPPAKKFATCCGQ